MITSIDKILKTFDTITLEEIDIVKLLNRVDTKYTFNIDLLPSFLDDLKLNYNVLNIENNRLCRYETLYFDTPDLNLYRLHHNGKSNRYKVRTRKYVESDTVFFEIKYKTNKSRTLKARFKRKKIYEAIDEKAKMFIQQCAPNLSTELIPSIFIFYSRITLVSKNLSERLTIDIDLNYKFENKSKSYSNLVIAELKQDMSAKSNIIPVLNKFRIQDVSISKYCLGIISIYDNIKKNNFKQKLRDINKINYENI